MENTGGIWGGPFRDPGRDKKKSLEKPLYEGCRQCSKFDEGLLIGWQEERGGSMLGSEKAGKCAKQNSAIIKQKTQPNENFWRKKKK